MGAVTSGPFAASAAAPSGFAATAASEQPKSNRKQILIAVCLLALAIGGALGLLLRHHKTDNSASTNGSGSNTAQPGGGTGVTPAPQANPVSHDKRPQKPPVTPPGAKPGTSTAQDANTLRIIGIVGEIDLGDAQRPDEIALQNITIRQESKPACVNLATAETVAYVNVNRQDLTERIIVDAIEKSHPKTKGKVKVPEVKHSEMTEQVRKACGSDYDAIVILAAKVPPPPGGNDPSNGVPHATDSHDPQTSHYARPRPHSGPPNQ